MRIRRLVGTPPMPFRSLLPAVASFLLTAACLGPAQAADANADLETLLATGGCTGCDLRGVHLEGRVLTIQGLSHTNLSGANLSGIELRAQSISHVDFTNANLHGARIWANSIGDSQFVNTDLSEAYLGTSSGHGQHWIFTQNRFLSSNLRKARIETDICYHSHFENSDLTGFSMISYEVIRYCTVTNAKADQSFWDGFFINQVFSKTSLVGASFTEEKQSNIDFLGCDLRNAVLGDVDGQARNNYTDSNLSGARIKGVVCAEGSVGVCNPGS
ncbi:pentapeptide repeat-containing protein [Polyangium fumosum]|uniref:Pentapeptide repeat-containing protein n=1 Tax=Polyangium fumosum TaxID=889272 RepID=A0A4U1J1Q0_9BACT|nr:pentapeptide repeat-containing protein [Polyangium fumosum]TKD00905.1 pentapeptide repeat-containing protein [Polyangium fumosum]